MRLSNKQYKLFVRTGIALVIVAVFAFDRVPAHFQLPLVGLALIGAFLGFFPLFTSHPFESTEESDDRLNAEVKSDLALPAANEDIHLSAQNRSGAMSQTWAEILATRAFSTVKGAAPQAVYYLTHDQHIDMEFDQDMVLHSYRAIWAEKRDERQARVKEVHDLIAKLTGKVQKFSIQLTNDNAIVVHCEDSIYSAEGVDEEAETIALAAERYVH